MVWYSGRDTASFHSRRFANNPGGPDSLRSLTSAGYRGGIESEVYINLLALFVYGYDFERMEPWLSYSSTSAFIEFLRENYGSVTNFPEAYKLPSWKTISHRIRTLNTNVKGFESLKDMPDSTVKYRKRDYRIRHTVETILMANCDLSQQNFVAIIELHGYWRAKSAAN